MSTQLWTVQSSSLAGQLITASPHWQAYTHHRFVEQLAQGTLPQACFQHYLVQDYLFLIHFSRAWALAGFKAQSIDDIRACSATVHALINEELTLHIGYCASFGISEEQMAATQEHPANIAYTRYVMERGLAGDLLDLLVALAPCVIGYGEIGARLGALKTAPEQPCPDHPYQDWIDMYASADYRQVVEAAATQLDRVASLRLGGRMAELQATFDMATRLEVGFWDMGMEATA